MIQLTTFRWVPPFAQGLVKDLRVRWALEEAGIPYETRLIGREDQSSESYRKLQPFGQVPVIVDGDLTLFESGSIVLHIAEKAGNTLLPKSAEGRARAVTWVFAAISSIEPAIQNLSLIDLFHPNEEWAKLRRPGAVETLRDRLRSLSAWMKGREYLENEFTTGDLMMTTVLRIPRHIPLIEEFPLLHDYKNRCEQRPAFQRALDAQMKLFAENAPAAQ